MTDTTYSVRGYNLNVEVWQAEVLDPKFPAIEFVLPSTVKRPGVSIVLKDEREQLLALVDRLREKILALPTKVEPQILKCDSEEYHEPHLYKTAWYGSEEEYIVQCPGDKP